jgi:tryptophan-rich sensory protein
MLAATAIIMVLATSLAGSYFTSKNVRSTPKSPSSPPDYVFPVVWTTLYALLAVALTRISLQSAAGTVFAINLVLNVVWCYLYFERRNVSASAVCLAAIIATTVAIMWMCRRDAVVVYCMAPYLAWLIFALYLNLDVYFILRSK